MILREDLYEYKNSQPMKFLNFSSLLNGVFIISQKKKRRKFKTELHHFKRSFGFKLHPLQKMNFHYQTTCYVHIDIDVWQKIILDEGTFVFNSNYFFVKFSFFVNIFF